MRHLRLLEYIVEISRIGSIRKAAEKLNITASALNRRIQDLEEELGAQLFERRARGVQLTAAGEMFVRHAQAQLSESEQIRSRIEDLKGLRRGPVRLACSQALATDFLPSLISEFRRTRPGITFDLRVMDHDQAAEALMSYDVDLALIYRLSAWPSISTIATLPQRLVVIMRDDHPLAALPAVRLSDCLSHPLALPDRSLGGRQVLEAAIARRDLRLAPQAVSNSFEMLRGLVIRCNMLTVQIEIGAPPADLPTGLISRPIADRDIPRANLVLCQLRGRTLPVSASSFAELIKLSLAVHGQD